MTFTVSKLFWDLFAPGNFLLLLAVAGLCLRPLRRRRRVGGLLLSAGLGGLVALAVLPLGQWALEPLEARFPMTPVPARVDGVVVLGGGVDSRTSDAIGRPAMNAAGERMTEMVALARRFPDAKIVFSGGSGLVLRPDLEEARWVETLAGELGVPAGHLLVESDSRNTWENALYTKALVQPRPDETWLLVTSAWHMPRAVGSFRAAGWTVVPWPVDYRSHTDDAQILGIRLRGGLEAFETAAREWLGLTAYHLLGRTDALFPAPRPVAADAR